MFLQIVQVSAKRGHYLGHFIKKRYFQNVSPIRRKSHLSRLGSQKVRLVFKVGSHTFRFSVNKISCKDIAIPRKGSLCFYLFANAIF